MTKKKGKKVQLPPESEGPEVEAGEPEPTPPPSDKVSRRGGKKVSIAPGASAAEPQGQKANKTRRTSNDKDLDDQIAAAASAAQSDGEEDEADSAQAKPPKAKQKYVLATEYLTFTQLTS